jgi:hypothetical protein
MREENIGLVGQDVTEPGVSGTYDNQAYINVACPSE